MKINKVATIIPLFQYTREYRNQCSTTGCYERMFKDRPKNITEVKMCFRQGYCQMANAHLTTRV